jgi:hypothetical protein
MDRSRDKAACLIAYGKNSVNGCYFSALFGNIEISIAWKFPRMRKSGDLLAKEKASS